MDALLAVLNPALTKKTRQIDKVFFIPALFILLRFRIDGVMQAILKPTLPICEHWQASILANLVMQ